MRVLKVRQRLKNIRTRTNLITYVRFSIIRIISYRTSFMMNISLEVKKVIFY